MTPDPRHTLELWLLAALLVGAGYCSAAQIEGQSVGRATGARLSIASSPAAAEWYAPNTPSDVAAGHVAVTLARVCWKEASFSAADCAAIGYALRARAARVGLDVASVAYSYSLRANTARTAAARALPNGDCPSFTARENARWAELRAVARATVVGATPNPCPHATHWGSRHIATDRNRAAVALSAGRWREVRCRPGTLNAFYVEVRTAVSASLARGAW